MKTVRWMVQELSWTPVVLLLGFLLGAVQATAQEEVRLDGGSVSVYNLAGEVEIVRGSGSQVQVQVMRGGADGDRIALETIQVDGREALVLRYPDDRIVYPEIGRNSRTQLRVRGDGTFGDGSWGRGDRVDIRGSGRGMEAWADLRISMPAGSDLRVYQAVGQAEVTGVDGTLLVDTGSGGVRARSSSGELDIDTGSGSIWVEEFMGDLNVDTGSGEVEISAVEGRDILVDTGSGSIRADGITARELEVDTGSGSVTLTRVSAPDVMVDTGTGEVEVELMEDVDRLEVDTGSGEVVIRMPPGVGAEVEVDTGSGDIDVDIELEVREVRRSYLRGIIGDGRGRIRIDTGSGGIRLIGG